ncbi:MAG TPA: DUF4386 domain-containing protein [Gaiellaceae bacterium]|jgi:hypothetical protein|nr:DUF4386 domain-containing protein [Gaiellaceae bacterium]
MDASDQRTARLVGWLFIGTFVFSIPAVLLYGPVLDDDRYILGGGHDRQIAFGAFLEILTVVCNIGTAVALYRVGKRYSQTLSLAYVASRIVESTLIAAGVVSLLSVVTLRHDLASSGADAAALTVAGHTLVAFHDWTFLLGPSFCAGIGNGVLLGYLMFRSGLVPRPLARVALVGGPLAIVAAAGVLFGVYDQDSHPQLLLTLPEIVWEASFGIYLVVRGFKAPIASAVARAFTVEAYAGSRAG